LFGMERAPRRTGGSAIGLSATGAWVKPLPVIQVNVAPFTFVSSGRFYIESMPAPATAILLVQRIIEDHKKNPKQ